MPIRIVPSKVTPTPEEQLQAFAIKRDPIGVGRKLGYDIHKLSPKDSIDRGDYEEGYRYRVSSPSKTKPYPDIFMARTEKEISDYILSKARRIEVTPAPEVTAIAKRDAFLQEQALTRNKALIDEEITKAGNREIGMRIAADRLQGQVDTRTGMPIEQNITDAQLIRKAATLPAIPKTEAGNPKITKVTSVKVKVGDSVCDKYTGSCGRVTEILNDEVALEPTIIKKGGWQVTEPPIKAKIANLEPNHIKRYEEAPSSHKGSEKGGNPMTTQEMEQLAQMVAEKIKEDSSTAVLILHSVPHAYGSPGIMVDPDIAARTPCKCYNNICFSKGIIGSMSKAQREAYCPTTEHITSPRMTKRLENWQEAVGVCKKEIEKFEKGERLEPWLSCMGRELPKRGIEI